MLMRPLPPFRVRPLGLGCKVGIRTAVDWTKEIEELKPASIKAQRRQVKGVRWMRAADRRIPVRASTRLT